MKSDKLFSDEAVKTLKEQEKDPPIWLFRLILVGSGLAFLFLVCLGWYGAQRVYEGIASRQTPTTADLPLDLGDEWRFPFPMRFAGPNDALTLGETVIKTPEFSFSIWFKTGVDHYAQIILGNYRPCSYSNNGFILVYYGTPTVDGARLELVNGGGTDFAQRFGVLSDNQWHHAVGVFSGQQMLLYLDGKLAGTVFEPYTPTAVDLQIGMADAAQSDCAYGNSNYFVGEMSDLRIYQYPLAESEISDLWQEKP